MSSISATGYIHRLIDENQTFAEFVLASARQMSILYSLRDQPMDAPLPEKLEPAGYWDNEVAERTQKLAELEALTTEQDQHAYGWRVKDEEIQWHLKEHAAQQKDLARVRETLAAVEAWEIPPDEDLDGLKRVMLEQLNECLRINGHGYHEKAARELGEATPLAFFERNLDYARRDVASAREYQQKELDRTARANQWLTALRESLK